MGGGVTGVDGELGEPPPPPQPVKLEATVAPVAKTK